LRFFQEIKFRKGLPLSTISKASVACLSVASKAKERKKLAQQLCLALLLACLLGMTTGAQAASRLTRPLLATEKIEWCRWQILFPPSNQPQSSRIIRLNSVIRRVD